MLLASYKDSNKLFYTNFLEATQTSGLFGYRGDLVLIPGEVGDDKGHLKPPKLILREAVVLADDKIKMLLGGLDDIASLPVLLEKYQGDFAPDMSAMIFVVNLAEPMQLNLNGARLMLIPLIQGVPWNETMEELALEKSNFKGQKPADKLVTMYEVLREYTPKYPTATLDDALAAATNAKRELQGAV